MDDCIEWTGARSPSGYGITRIDGRATMAHRVAYQRDIGPIPEGLVLDHLCRNRACVNPRHLEPVTNRVNVLRGIGPSAVNATKTHCPEGHPLDGARKSGVTAGHRFCTVCKTDSWDDYYARRGSEMHARRSARRPKPTPEMVQARLEAAARAEEVRRAAIAAGPATCRHGHSLADAKVVTRRGALAVRCRECFNQVRRNARAARRSALTPEATDAAE